MGVKHRMVSESKSACGRLVTQGDGRPCKNCERVVYVESVRAEAHAAKVNAATVNSAPTVEEVETAYAAAKQNGRVFVAEAHNFARPEAFAQAVTDGLLTLVDDDDMSRYVPTRRTADGVIITQGLPVWDYNLDPGTVDLTSISSDGWFHVHTVKGGHSLMNAERVATRHPFSRALASDALAALAEPAEVEIHTGDGTVITTDDAPATVARVGDDYLNVSPPPNVPRINSGIPHVFVPKAIGDGSGPLFCVAPCHGHVSMPFHITEEEVWSGTGTLIKPTIRTLLGRRKRKATKKARRAVKGGF